MHDLDETRNLPKNPPHQATETEPETSSERVSPKRPALSLSNPVIVTGSIVFITLVVIFGGLLFSFWRQPGKPAPIRSVRPQHTALVRPSKPRVIPTPAGTPIASQPLSNYNPSATVADGVVYAGTSDNAVYALRTSDGSVLWRTKIEGTLSTYELPLIVNSVVYVNSYAGDQGPGYVYALRASDGAILWHYTGNKPNYNTSNPNNYIYAPVIENSVAYLTSQDGTVLALNANSGAVLWRYSLEGLAYNSPLFVNGVLYVDSNKGTKPDTFYALRALDGAVLWRHEISGFVPTPIISNGVIYLSNGSTLLALHASDGQQLWVQKFDADELQFAQLVNGVLYFTTTKMLLPTGTTGNVSPPEQAMTFGNLLWNDLQTVPTRPLKEGRSSVYAVQASDGEILWHFDLNKGENSWASWLSTVRGVIYVGSNDIASTSGSHVYALRGSDGSVLWEDEISASSSGAMVANGVIYLGAALDQAVGAVYALRASDGSSLWSYPLNGATFGTPILVDTTLYVSTSNETIFALRAENGSLAWHRFIGPGA